MKTRTKIFSALLAAGLLGAGALAVAQPGAACDGYRTGMMGGARNVSFDPAARVEQRLTQFKTDLKLTSAQEPLWTAFADKAKAEAGKGFQTMRDTAQDLSLSAPERMDRMTEAMKQRVAAMESVNTSFKQLYDSLSADQRRVADIHAANMGKHGRMGHWRRGGPDGRMAPPADTAPTKG
ncbi:MAG: Spy/CpxP family protein refolding chaperone [Gammaproteobacteria bacterium]|nr:Spy/CpxP family protein refolding chaperone [Gammaproteobacteria bacterium]MBU1415536.1 Spy/CpxP family protein refolding chaperone [Gammaproteobacteria bacterium]